MTTAGRIGPRRDTHLNISQKEALLEMMCQNPNLALNGYSKTERQAMWDALASRLNLHGPPKSGAQWEAAWQRYKSRAKYDTECDAYRPVKDVVKYCEDQLARLGNANLGNRASSNQDNVGRRRSRGISMNNNDIEQILHQLTQSNRKRRELGKQIEAFQADVKAMMNKLTRLSSGVNRISNN